MCRLVSGRFLRISPRTRYRESSHQHGRGASGRLFNARSSRGDADPLRKVSSERFRERNPAGVCEPALAGTPALPYAMDLLNCRIPRRSCKLSIVSVPGATAQTCFHQSAHSSSCASAAPRGIPDPPQDRLHRRSCFAILRHRHSRRPRGPRRAAVTRLEIQPGLLQVHDIL